MGRFVLRYLPHRFEHKVSGTLRMWIPTVYEHVEGCVLQHYTLLSGSVPQSSWKSSNALQSSDVPRAKAAEIWNFAVWSISQGCSGMLKARRKDLVPGVIRITSHLN